MSDSCDYFRAHMIVATRKALALPAAERALTEADDGPQEMTEPPPTNLSG
ncbi:hypothetical protein [Bradyrhizobium iriomotense]|uniref:Uncharacterized protein n=1 Tax=Bradyrhizobium iriomotense TaxID=441950 RepID=A0ABQ6B9S3_9BRAD|nr:hypothetical protein [Bradyrhizobium iriomotense]GLR90793.1 hypothetical protein GCM10007857_75080 [Bradyrhizobium iriomotense]